MANIKLNDPYVNFLLPSTEGNNVSLDMADLGEYKLVIFSCNHCPYAQAWEDRIINIQKKYKSSGLSTIMISSNDAEEYPEDNFQKMKERHSEKKFNFPYLFDETQEVAKSYGAVCTPDFFGYGLEFDGLQYRGRIRKLKNLQPIYSNKEGNKKNIKDISELRLAMEKIALTGKGPKKQVPSMGCNIKWFNK